MNGEKTKTMIRGVKNNLYQVWGRVLADDCNSYRYKGGAVGTTDVVVGIVKPPLPGIFLKGLNSKWLFVSSNSFSRK